MTCKYETHLHTKQGSACGNNTGAEMADYYKNIGYQGIIITDHFLNGNTAIPHALPWEEKVELFCKGFEDAERRGHEIELDVFFGFEFNWYGTEFLVYGLTKQWLSDNPDIISIRLEDALARFKAAGAFIVQAHPFREAPYIDTFRLIPKFTDAVETYNCLNRREHNERAEVYAKMFGLKETSGGDAHGVGSHAGGIEIHKRAHTIHELINVIQHGSYSLIKGTLLTLNR
jgi:hypothetical protein